VGDDLPIQRCTVFTQRSQSVGARSQHMHEELGQRLSGHDLTLNTDTEFETRRKRSLRNNALKAQAVAPRVPGRGGDRLFTFTRLDPTQWKPARTNTADRTA